TSGTTCATPADSPSVLRQLLPGRQRLRGRGRAGQPGPHEEGTHMSRRRIEQSPRSNPGLFRDEGDPQSRAWKTLPEAEKRREALELGDRIRSGKKDA